MGKKAKVGKQRRDKYYHLAKETGYRSRSAYKLLQLNRKFEFLQKSRVLIDLCAAPGGWLQVASKTMPVSSVVVGVDLFPIKPVPRVSTLVADITTEKCRKGLKKELHHWKADCVLHDGAPNVGTNWLLDAHTQARLTLQATKLACEFLNKGGWFVTKVFRSRDYQSLVWVFHQLFHKVHATKPAASRHESAEIFVVCQGYIAPDKIDPKFFEPKYIFKELAVESAKKKLLILQDPTKIKKAKAEGYADEDKMSLYRAVNMTDFLNSEDPVTLLNECSELIFDAEEIESHRLTTDEIKECAKDIKVLGRREIRLLLTWHKNVKKVLENAEKWHKESTKPKDDKEEDKVNDEEEDSMDEDKLESEVKQLENEERITTRRLQKTAAKKKRKLRETLQKLGMMQARVTEDEGPDKTTSLFKLHQMKNREDLSEVEKGDLSFLDKDGDDSDEEELPEERVKYKVSKKGTKEDPTDPDDADDEDEDSDIPSDLEEDEKTLLREEKAKRTPQTKVSSDTDSDSDEEAPTNPLMVDLDESSSADRAQRTTSLWFSKDVFAGLEMDEDEDMEISQMSEYYQKMGGSIREKSANFDEANDDDGDSDEETERDSSRGQSSGRRVSFNKTVFSMDDSGNRGEEEMLSGDDEEQEDGKPGKGIKPQNGQIGDDDDTDSSSGEDSDYEEDVETSEKDMTPLNKSSANKDGFEIVPTSKSVVPIKKLDPCGLAIGEKIATSKKNRREVIDHAYNRYVYGEEEGLPEWFARSERIHCRRIMPVTKEQVAKYKERLREINARPIKKIAQAKARKKLRYLRKLEKLKKKAEAIGDTLDTSEKEKYSQIKNLYKKAGLDGKRTKQVTYVVAKKGLRGKRIKRPRGLKGPYKVVDTRMKADMRGKKANDSRRKKASKKRQR